MGLSVLQHGFKTRSPRTQVFLPSRLRTGSVWADACIHNVSRRGLLVACDKAPEPGSYVEIRRGPTVIIGRAVWKRDRFFGVRTQDSIDLQALQETPTSTRARSPADQPERRSEDRFRKDAAVARTLERNRMISRMMQFGLIVAASLAATGAVAAALHGVVSAPLERIQQVLSPGP